MYWLSNKLSSVFLSLFSVAGLSAQSNASSTPLIINEICTANIDQNVDPSYNYGAWLELYNPTNATISISNWRFSDDPENLRKACMRGTTTVPSKGYALVWFDHYDPKYGTKMVDMKPDVDGGTLYISDNSGQLLLTLDYPEAVARCSWARTSLDADTWSYCSAPTPGRANAGSYCMERLAAPEVDRDSYVGSGSVRFNVTIPEGCTLRFTTDGSTPTLTNGNTSTTGTFAPSSTMLYRFRLFADGYLPSPVVMRSFIKSTYNIDLPIVSISGTQSNFYSANMGIFTQGNNGRPGRGHSDKCNWNMDWERPAFFEYFAPNGTLLFSQEVALERCGGWSRAWQPWSFKIKANKVFEGQSWLAYPFFDEKPYVKNKTLQIRNGGNDNGCRIKDAALQQIVARAGLDVDYQAYQPVAHFVNGVYKGSINMREANNRHFVYSNYGFDDEDLDQFEIGPDSGYYQSCGTKESFNRLIALSKQCGSTDVMPQISQLLDIDSYCNYMAVELYLGNWDWPQNNVKGYRPRFEDGKFRFILFDLDGAFNLSTNAFSTFQGKQIYTFDQLYDAPVSRYYNVEIEFVSLFLNLLNDSSFRKRFTDAFCLVAGSVFEPVRCKEIVNELANRVAQTQGTVSTWSGPESPWSTANDVISHLSSSRQSSMVSALRSYSKMQLTGKTAQKLVLKSSQREARILYNGQPVPDNYFNGQIFAPVTLTASAPAGYVFAGWKNSSSSANTILANNATWRYYDKGSLDGRSWQSTTYNDASWLSGKAPLGYFVGGNRNYGTTISYGSDANNKRPTYYFRTTVDLPAQPASSDDFTLNFTVDDGFIIYVNGQEAGRYNMPSGNVSYSTYASTYAQGNPDTGSMTLDASLFHAGSNLLAVEVHNNSGNSTDIYWSASLSHSTITGGTLVCETPDYTLPATGSLNVVACFEPIAPDASNPLPPVVINEVSAANSIYVCDYLKKHDWLELYNTTSEPIDLTGMYLTDKVGKPQKWQISAEGSEASTVIPAHGYKLIWCDKLASDRELHAPFLLGNEDNSQVMLSAEDGSWKSVLTYSAHEGTSSVGRYPDGADQVYLMTRTTPGSTNQVTTISPVVEQPSTIHTLPADAAPDTWALYDLGGRLLDQGEGTIRTSLPAGIYLVREGNQVRKVMIK